MHVFSNNQCSGAFAFGCTRLQSSLSIFHRLYALGVLLQSSLSIFHRLYTLGCVITKFLVHISQVIHLRLC